MLITDLDQQKCIALIKFMICNCNLDFVRGSKWSHKANMTLPFLTPPVFFARCDIWGQLAQRSGSRGLKREPVHLLRQVLPNLLTALCDERKGGGGRCLPPGLS